MDGLTAYQRILLRDIRDGHLTIWRGADGSGLLTALLIDPALHHSLGVQPGEVG